jgi:hypothetical protein
MHFTFNFHDEDDDDDNDAINKRYILQEVNMTNNNIKISKKGNNHTFLIKYLTEIPTLYMEVTRI